jgi:serine/threonine-protein kinase
MTNNNNLILSGRYELLKPLGRGQSGTVYLARQQSLELERAVKLIPKTNAPSLFAISEAQILKSVQHPGIPTIYDFEEDESFFYLVEEYIQGDSLEEFLLHQQSISQNLYFQFCEQLCDIFAYLHTLRPSPILYQDLKPEHIIVCGLQVKLIDFSVASFITNSGNDLNYFGNVDFSAPELSSGNPVSLTSDLYSIGRVMEYMAVYLDASTVRNIYPIIQKATSADPRYRYQTINELSAALHNANDNTGRMHLRQNIAVIGSYSGCGCTHIAISLVSALNFLGFSAVYQEKNQSNSLRKSIMQMEHVWEQDGTYCHRCFKGYPQYDKGVEIPEPTAEIIVDDYGCEYSSSSLATADMILYVCGGALWHRDDARPEDFLLQQFRGRLHLVANLCDKNSAIYYARKFSLPVYRYPFDPDIFRADKRKQDFVHWLSIEKGGNRLFSHLRNHFFRHLQQ